MQSPPAKLYVDMDDVLCETARALTAIAEREFGKTVQVHEVTTFNLEIALGLTPEQTEDLMHMVHRPDVLGRLDVRDGAIDALSGFADRGIEIVVVTGRPPHSGETTQQWLVDFEIPHHGLLHVDKYGRVDGAETSFRVLEMHELVDERFTLAVEDSGEVALALARDYALPVALLDRPWNRLEDLADFEEAGSVTRCAGWPEVRQVVDRVVT